MCFFCNLPQLRLGLLALFGVRIFPRSFLGVGNLGFPRLAGIAGLCVGRKDLLSFRLFSFGSRAELRKFGMQNTNTSTSPPPAFARGSNVVLLQLPAISWERRTTASTAAQLYQWMDCTAAGIAKEHTLDVSVVREELLLGLFLMPGVNAWESCYDIRNPIGYALFKLQHCHYPPYARPESYERLLELITALKQAHAYLSAPPCTSDNNK